MHPLTWILPPTKVKPSARFSAVDLEANEIALGFLQISTLPSGPWNDPTAPALSEAEKQMVAEQWGVHSRADWLGMIEHLTTVRRRRHAWMAHLAAMHWSDGELDGESFAKFADGWSDFRAAAAPKRGGPWATLPWPTTVDVRSPHRIG